MRFFSSPLCALLLAAFVVALPVRSSPIYSVWLLQDLLTQLQAPENDMKRGGDFITNKDNKRGTDFIKNKFW